MKKIQFLLFLLFMVACESDPVIYTLKVEANPSEGGTVSTITDKLSGTTAIIKANPAAEYLFDKWTGDASGTDTTISLVIDSDKSIIANFVKKQYALTSSVDGEGSVSEKIIKTGSATDYISGTIVELTANPSAEWVFSEWKGDLTGTENPKQIIVDKVKSVTAVFVKKQYLLTTVVEGKGSVSEKIIKTGAASDYTSGTILELTATPTSGWGFKEWKGDLTGTENPKQITVDKPKEITAVFEVLDQDPFYLDSNGLTIKAKDWVTAGTTGEINGVKYTAVDRDMLISMVQNGDDVTNVVTSLITVMNHIFNQKYSFNQDISSWDVSNVTKMKKMFYRATAFDNTFDISNWDVSSVTDMSSMFEHATSFNQNIGNWDVSNVTDMRSMFKKATIFNQDISDWDVSNVTEMSYMFSEAENFNQDLTKWCVPTIKTEPENFNTFSSLFEDVNKPLWGKCPVWRGNSITFSKTGSDPTIEANQDRITSNVWITRGSSGQIYNIKKESSSNKTNSPLGTKWAVGTLDQISYLTFEKFREAVGNPSNVVGKNLVMFLEDDEIYLSVKFTSWAQGKNGGFAYERTNKP